MINVKSLTLAVISITSAMFVFSSCDFKEDLGGKGHGAIKIKVSTDNGVDTKSNIAPTSFDVVDLSQDGLDFFMSTTMSRNMNDVFSPATKATIITTENLGGQRNRFDLDVLGGSKPNSTTVENIKTSASYNESTSLWSLDTEVDFPDNNENGVDFWAYSYIDGVTRDNSDYSKFSYVAPAELTNMSDVLVANTVGAKDNDVHIMFYHALTAVKFAVADKFKNDGHKMIEVQITGVAKEGTAQFASNKFTTVVKEEKNEDGTITSTTKDFDIQYKWTPDYSEDKTVSYTLLLYDASNPGSVVSASAEDMTMFFIPQNLENVRFTFNIIDKNNKSYALTTDNLGTKDWMPGYIYNYTLGNDVWGNVGIKVQEKSFENNKKDDVYVENTKSASAYIRVAIVANWCTTGTVNKPVEPYDITKIGYNNEAWYYNDPKNGGDGFFYSRYPVLGHMNSEVLVDEFELKDHAPVSPYELHLEINFIAQAVAYDTKVSKLSTAEWTWGDDFKKLLTSKEVHNTIK